MHKPRPGALILNYGLHGYICMHMRMHTIAHAPWRSELHNIMAIMNTYIHMVPARAVCWLHYVHLHGFGHGLHMYACAAPLYRKREGRVCKECDSGEVEDVVH